MHHLDFISQFRADIRHVSGINNPVADALSRTAINTLDTVQQPVVDFEAMARAQVKHPELQTLVLTHM